MKSGLPFWPIRDGLPGAYPPLTENIDCEVAIIGGGLSGALVGLHLAEALVDAVVLDRSDVAGGSTAASTALIQYEPDLSLHRLGRVIGVENARRAYQLCHDALDDLQELCGRLEGNFKFERTESLLLASRPRDLAGLEKEFSMRLELGHEMELLTARDLRKRSSLRHPGALLTRKAAHLDAYAFTHALLAEGRRQGLRVFDRTAVTGFRKTAGKRFDLFTDRGCKVRARRIVIAAGYESSRYFRRQWGDLNSTYAIVTEPMKSLPGWPGKAVLWETARPYVYARIADGDRVIIGGYDEPFQDARRRDALLAAKSRALRRLRAFFPAMRCETAFAWTGTFAETKDSLPYIGQSPEHDPGVYSVLGYGSNGTIFSMLGAQIIRDLHLGRKPEAAALRCGTCPFFKYALFGPLRTRMSTASSGLPRRAAVIAIIG
ncbi:MAG: NAD(P)/FAD-dependent oxidoreductase [Opitutaceae bacterium]